MLFSDWLTCIPTTVWATDFATCSTACPCTVRTQVRAVNWLAAFGADTILASSVLDVWWGQHFVIRF